MNILISGANGLLGSNLVKILSENHKVFALIENYSKINFSQNQNTTILEKDLTNFEMIDFPDKIDTVYFLAQSNRFRDFPDGVTDMLKVNIEAPLRIAKWAVEKKVKKFIYASSGGVYRKPYKPVKEFFDINANEKNGFYLDSKLSAEILLKNFASLFETFVIIRPFFIYGKNQKTHMLIPRLLNNIQESNEIILNSDNGIRINPIHVSDAAMAFSNIINLKGEYIINVAGKEIINIRELCEMIGKKLNVSAVFKRIDTPQNDLVADISLMIDKLYSPKIDLEIGLNDLINNR